ncbi:GntR family transcriptional regulator [Aerococcaceae bacterium 50-4]
MVKYKSIAQEITNYILENQLKRHDKLPVIDEMALDFNVSKSTIIKALDILEAKGQIYQVQGSGVFVRDVHIPGRINLNRPEGLTRTLSNTTIVSRVAEVALIKPDETIQEYLECDPDEDIYMVKRTRYIKGEIHSFETSYFRKKYVRYMNEQIARGSIFTYLEDNLDLKPSFSNAFFQVKQMGDEVSRFLEVTPDTYGLELINQFFLSNGAIFDYSVLWYSPNHAQFFVPSNFY